MLVPMFTGPTERNVRYARPTNIRCQLFNKSFCLFIGKVIVKFWCSSRFFSDDQGNRKMLLLIERQRARLLVIVPNPFQD